MNDVMIEIYRLFFKGWMMTQLGSKDDKYDICMLWPNQCIYQEGDNYIYYRLTPDGAEIIPQRDLI